MLTCLPPKMEQLLSNMLTSLIRTTGAVINYQTRLNCTVSQCSRPYLLSNTVREKDQSHQPQLAL